MAHRIALLVDGDNISAAYADQIMQIAAKSGRVDIAQVYGNAQTASGWLAAASFHFVHAGTGKNATDLLLTIDAMELALTAGIEGFVIVSSDGDFSHLAWRLKKHGLLVTGIGEAKAPRSFRAACTAFHQLKPASAQPTPKLALVNAKAPPLPTPHQSDAFCQNVKNIILAKSPDGQGMKIADLNAAMHKAHGAKISDNGAKNWRRYLLAHPALFDLDPQGPDARVRLKHAGSHEPLKLVKS